MLCINNSSDDFLPGRATTLKFVQLHYSYLTAFAHSVLSTGNILSPPFAWLLDEI